jgi:hypothetical protein
MPEWLRRQLDQGGKITTHNQISTDGKIEKVIQISNETSETLLVVARLCHLDLEVDRTIFCHPGVVHVSKMSREGSFCGYRNIQMMISYIQSSQTAGHDCFQGRLPSVLELQDVIEDAWDKGINTTSRLETGGIRGTRKYIGTPEV